MFSIELLNFFVFFSTNKTKAHTASLLLNKCSTVKILIGEILKTYL